MVLWLISVKSCLLSWSSFWTCATPLDYASANDTFLAFWSRKIDFSNLQTVIDCAEIVKVALRRVNLSFRCLDWRSWHYRARVFLSWGHDTLLFPTGFYWTKGTPHVSVAGIPAPLWTPIKVLAIDSLIQAFALFIWSICVHWPGAVHFKVVLPHRTNDAQLLRLFMLDLGYSFLLGSIIVYICNHFLVAAASDITLDYFFGCPRLRCFRRLNYR